ncbi:hypothetical protein BDR26DRAFT_879595 [Obelidium mucronatum]|nr:hypothetical protein BDR26DRAFT_879595 [Obelidium mucronatum]
MDLTHLLAVVAPLLTALSVDAACTNQRIRRAEKAGYITAIKALATRAQSLQYNDPGFMSWDDFAYTHARNAWWSHANAQFLVYHRAMLHMMELALESVNWFAAHQTTWQSLDLFTDQYFGTQGSAGQCLISGQFSVNSGFQVNTDRFPNKCLDRCGGGVFWSSSQMNSILSSARSYNDIRYDDTINFHAAGHAVLGGSCSMGDPSWSPRDPVFYLHHAYVDKHYWKWQQLCPSYKNSYEGNLQATPGGPAGQPVNPSQPLDSFSQFSAGDMFDTNSDPLCYIYTKSAGDVDYTHPTCPDGSKPNYNAYYQGALPPVRFSTPPGTPTGTPAPGPTRSPLPDNPLWTENMLNGLIAPPALHALGGKAKRADDVEEKEFDPLNSYSVTPGPNGQTFVNVTADGVTESYVIPSGCQLYKAYFDRITVLPKGTFFDSEVGLHANNPCPVALHPKCEDFVCERYPGAVDPTPSDPHQYPTSLSEEFIKAWHMDACVVRKSDCKVRYSVDKLNAEAKLASKPTATSTNSTKSA